MLIDGMNFGDGPKVCHLPVVVSDVNKDNTWFMGNLLMVNYYYFLDASPIDEYDLDYLQVGIGKINKVDEISPMYLKKLGKGHDGQEKEFEK
jgi:hypothetical protein